MPEVEAAGMGFWGGSIGIYAFHYAISGVDWFVAVRGSAGGLFHLIDYHTAPGRVINSALAEADNSDIRLVTVVGADYPLEISVTFPASELILEGMGRSTFLDGDGLATNIHAIVISGYTDCIVKDLAVQTEDGGGKNCHCVFIEDGADRFRVENVIVVASDTDGIHIEGTTISDGYVFSCHISAVDQDSISVLMDATNHTYSLQIESCVMSSSRYGIALFDTDGTRSHVACIINNNKIYATGNDGIHLYGIEGGTIEGNAIWGSIGNSIYLNGANHGPTVETYIMMVTISDNVATGAGGALGAISVVNSWHVVVDSNSCVDNTFDGIYVLDSSDVTVSSNCCSQNNRYGIQLAWTAGCRFCAVSGNIVEGNYQHGIYVNAFSTLIDGNMVYRNGQDDPGMYHGIYLAAYADDSIVSDNMIGNIDGEEVTEDGIYLATTVHRVNITGNYCQELMGSGITLVNDNDDNQIVGNYCLNNDDYGIEIANAAAQRNRVKENTLLGNGAGAILDNGTDTCLPEITQVVSDPDGSIGTYPAIVLTDGAQVSASFIIPIPSDFQELVRARMVLIPGGTGNLRRSASTNFAKICASEDYNTHTDSIAAGEVAVTINDVECIDVTAAFTGIAASDIVGLEFTRHGNHANDTVNADCYLLAFNMQYV